MLLINNRSKSFEKINQLVTIFKRNEEPKSQKYVKVSEIFLEN